VQCFVRPNMVVFPAVGIQPGLQMPSRKTSAIQRSLQRPVKPLDFSRCLRVPYAAPAQSNPLAHQPQRQLGSTRRRLLAPPRRAVIHQHGFWDAAAIKRCFQLLPHGLPVGVTVGRQKDHVAAMIVEHRQRTDRLRPSFSSLEIHLPQLIGLLALKALLGSRVLVYLFHQIVTQQNAMDRVPCQLNAFARKHNSQLARPSRDNAIVPRLPVVLEPHPCVRD